MADGQETWVEEADFDGFNLAYVLFPRSFEDVIHYLVPELQAKGLFWKDYAVPGGTHTESFYQKEGQTGPLDEHVASKYRWRAPFGRNEHHIPE